ncbi:DNA sulfur modification protein DndD [Alkalibacillus aidingensis]|uniref:DNA sulfur modification protein DndD n=1 Tax=Alkalibacillus aidingensis TaxID=2747607 RepID=UPI0016607248|nr:DNA sulfur modification protein DndD [Alkalibacillus aidingensis]
MILKKLIFDNYKTFYGYQEIDLSIPKEVRDEEGKNIILLGGLNGAGKTTILKAIIYILFGKRGMSETEHKRLFSNVINNTFFDEGGRESSVILALETDSGEEWQLKAKWYFDQYKRLTREERDLIVTRPGSRMNKKAKIDNIEVYNKFIDKIIPYHAAPFFIFDGEEIKEIILRQNSSEMKEAIHKITGMESYTQLITDLKSLQKTFENKLASSANNSKIKKYQEEISEIDKKIEKLEAQKEKVDSEGEQLKNKLEKEKEQRNEKISLNNNSREKFVKKQSQKETELDLARHELNQLYKNNVLSIILSRKINKLQQQLNLENEVKRKRLIEETSLAPYRDFMKQLLNKNIKPPLTESQLNQIKELGQEIWVKENNIDINTSEGFEEIHDLSSKDQNILINYKAADKTLITNHINKIEKLERDLRELEVEIRNAPTEVDISKENERIDSLTKLIGENNLKLRSVNIKLTKTKNEKSEITNKLTRLSGKELNVEEINDQYKLLQKTISTMEEYIEEVTTMKARFIQEEFSSMLNKLFRKQDEFGKIDFDIDSYTIRLYNDKMQEISIQDRSAGEMQMISSALIWALTKVSDLTLPIVVDTPLGRLDSHHRQQLINHYYKNLSDQIIILSTDTEITSEYVKLMEDHSYKQYMLDYDEEKKYTIIRDGYFDFITE